MRTQGNLFSVGIFLFAICAVFLYSGSALATVYVPDNYSTIQDAINDVKDGDTVIVRDGTYTGSGNVNIDFKGKLISVRSQNGAQSTIIDCQNQQSTRGFYFHTFENQRAVLDGFTIKNGNASAGGGIYCENASPTISNCIITSNAASSGNGGGIYTSNSAPFLSNLTVSNNSASNGGGIYCTGRTTLASLSIKNSTISSNSASYGGGIHYSSAGSPTIVYTTIDSNSTQAASNGDSYGGGLYSQDTSVSISSTYITNNSSGIGGGLTIRASTLTASNMYVRTNSVQNYGGGMYSENSSSSISSSVFSRNNAGSPGSSSTFGGGMYLYQSDTSMEKSYVSKNGSYGDAGGGIYTRSGTLNLTNDVIGGNYANSYGGGIYSDSSSVSIMNSTFGDNSTNISGGALGVSGTSPTLTNCILWNDTPDEISAQGTVSITYSTVQSGYSGTGNVRTDPKFYEAENYRLQSDSPAKNRGTANGAPIDDIEGHPRPSGTGTDMGAFEYVELTVWNNWFAVDSSETPMVGDFSGDGKTDIITFTRDNASAVGDVYVALSEGNKFGNSDKWNDWFAVDQTQTIVIGDFNGDGMSDIGSWLGKTTKEVYVSTSYGTGMDATGPAWLGSIGADSEDVIKAADVDGDGMADIVLFARKQGKVYVALSTGSSFSTSTVWHDFFAVSTYERPEVGDVDGDGKADIITFATDSPTATGDVYVALSNGSQFSDRRSSDKWNDWFAVDSNQRVRVGDIDGDGMADFATFLPPPYNQVYVVNSQGDSMSENSLAASGFPTDTTDMPFLGDVNGDGKADLVSFKQSEGKVYVKITE